MSFKLNKEQKQAVSHKEGPVLIVAGAGTGKTSVIASKMAYLIEKKLAKPEEILSVTFTEKAAQEMEERVDRMISIGYADLWISTFHSFASRILRENGLDIGLPTDFKMLDPTGSWLLIKNNFDLFNLDYYRPKGNQTKFISALVSHFSRCKDQDISQDDYLAYAQKDKTEDKSRLVEVANAYQTYQKLLLDNNYLDFGDLITYCLKLFKERPLILKKYRDNFKYILVDEFQDTNWSQYELIKMLALPQNNLTVSADDDQSVYKFRGASFGNILQFKKDFPKCKEIVLIKNYRSTQNILDLAYRFIQNNNPNRLEDISKIDKRLIADNEIKGDIEHLHCSTLEKETEAVIKKILKIDADYKDFAVLSRTNEGANTFAKACQRAEIPHRFLASKGLYSKPIILDIISYFNFLNNYLEDSYLYRVLNFSQLDIEDISKITQHSRKKSKSVYETIMEASVIIGFSKKSLEKVNNLLRIVKMHSELLKEKEVSKVFLAFLEDFAYLKNLDINEKENFDYLDQFYNKIKKFEEENHNPSLRNFISQLNLEVESGDYGSINFDPDIGQDVVNIMTIHTAKGLEFKHVFLINLVDKRFPVIERKEQIIIPDELIKDIVPEGDIHLEEERRLFYVAMTRAKRSLYFASAKDYGGKRDKKISRFLSEIGYSDNVMKNDLVLPILKKKKKETYSLPSQFSFTQLSDFRKCPLKYKYRYILKVPIKGKAVFSFGRTMHNTLFDFFMAYSKGEKLDIEEIYEKRWIDEWYDSKTQREQYYNSGKESLKGIIKDEGEILMLNDNPALEQRFNLKIDEFSINGAIDRIDNLGNGVEIIDYKTGKGKEKLSSSDREQLLIYQIATEEVFGLNPQKLTYYYLEEGTKKSFIGSNKDKESQKDKIVSEIKEILKSDFSSIPGWHCKSCDFNNICEHAQR